MSKPRANGTEKAIEARQNERERSREHQQHQQLQQMAFDDEGNLSREYLDALVDTGELQAGTIRHIRSMLSRSWAISNLTEAQEHDARWKLEALKLRVFGMHPPEESYFTGDARAFLMDDVDENLDPLSQSERTEIDSLIESIKAHITTGREGFQQEQLVKSVAVSRTEGDDQEQESSGWGLFS